ncbi:MAG: MotA/TolQ/ExbB proton channel family protein [Alphaproteobacteria bacterium]|nr:MotA/TolQ/ExbB proton channel family protein [Alphaproteobacteria bacterium]
MSNLIKNLIVFSVSLIVVHLAYIGYIRPQASLAIELARQAGQSPPRNIFIILKDYEQEICVILLLWSSYLILSKIREITSTHYLFKVDLLEKLDSKKATVVTTLDELENLPEDIRMTPLVAALVSSLRRYLITSSVQNTSDAITANVNALAIRLEAGNSMIRYLIWAIPSIGFIGTVRGIGQALSDAQKALGGDIASMTNSLGIAFNSTFVALLISIFLMFLLHQLQRMQDGLLVETQAYCEKFLLTRISM